VHFIVELNGTVKIRLILVKVNIFSSGNGYMHR